MIRVTYPELRTGSMGFTHVLGREKKKKKARGAWRRAKADRISRVTPARSLIMIDPATVSELVRDW